MENIKVNITMKVHLARRIPHVMLANIKQRPLRHLLIVVAPIVWLDNIKQKIRTLALLAIFVERALSQEPLHQMTALDVVQKPTKHKTMLHLPLV